MRVELSAQRSLERVLSQRALRIGNWLPCQMCVVGFFCGVCLTSLFLAVLTSSGAPEFGWFSISTTSSTTSTSNLSAAVISMVTTKSCNYTPTEPHVQNDFLLNNKQINEDHVRSLYFAWDFNKSDNGELGFPEQAWMNKLLLPKAPHLENCKLSEQINKLHDRPSKNEKLPRWTVWKGSLSLHPSASSIKQVEGLYPPWVAGSDEENYPLTRTVQRDIWLHQHPMNCDNASLRFLVADFEKMSGFGIGAQIAGMCGLLAIAINEKRVLITNYYNRADHDGCKGLSRSRWSCYFFPEASQECKERAFKLMQRKEAWDDGTITCKENYSSKEIWSARVPNTWGSPWKYIQPTTEINGTLVTSHRKMDRRWWRAQAVRYLMRFQTAYMCQLLNAARHSSFGWDAAQMVLENLIVHPQKNEGKSGIESYVWSNQKPWLPRPMLSMHVRMGDKACEMKVVEFEHYMRLAERIRNQFPQLKNIWLSTEMQEVIDKSKSYPRWNFYYTNVSRQQRNMTMASYEAGLGREISTNYPLVNFLMASEAEFFVGALGSTWCFLIDGMRNTGGKVMAGYLSVNKDRFW